MLLFLLAVADLEGFDEMGVHEVLCWAWWGCHVLQRQGYLVVHVEEMTSFPQSLFGLVSTCNDTSTTCYSPTPPEACCSPVFVI